MYGTDIVFDQEGSNLGDRDFDITGGSRSVGNHSDHSIYRKTGCVFGHIGILGDFSPVYFCLEDVSGCVDLKEWDLI